MDHMCDSCKQIKEPYAYKSGLMYCETCYTARIRIPAPKPFDSRVESFIRNDNTKRGVN